MHFLIFLTLSLIGASNAWDTQLTQDVYFTCPTHQAFYRIDSEHINSDPDDRYFAFYCRDYPTYFDHCQWTGFINWFTTDMLFSCGDNSVVAGIQGIYDHKEHDRGWRFFCCGSSEYRVINPYIEEIPSTINVGNSHQLDDSHWYHGAFSQYDDYHRDRWWVYEVASLLKL